VVTLRYTSNLFYSNICSIFLKLNFILKNNYKSLLQKAFLGAGKNVFLGMGAIPPIVLAAKNRFA